MYMEVVIDSWYDLVEITPYGLRLCWPAAV